MIHNVKIQMRVDEINRSKHRNEIVLRKDNGLNGTDSVFRINELNLPKVEIDDMVEVNVEFILLDSRKQ